MYFNENKIKEIIISVLKENDTLLIDYKFGKLKNTERINLWVDKESVLSVDDCYKISRQIENRLKDSNLWNESIFIEVSSPGVDKPLKYLEQYRKHLNRKFNIKYRTEDQIVKRVLTLKDIQGENLFFRENDLTIKFNDIIEAKVSLSFKKSED